MNTIEALREFKRLVNEKLTINFDYLNQEQIYEIRDGIEKAYTEILEKLIVTSNQHH